MMFIQDEKISNKLSREWRYYGKVTDKDDVAWCVYSNDYQQIRELQKDKEVYGMKLKGKMNENKNFRITRMLKGIEI